MPDIAAKGHFLGAATIANGASTSAAVNVSRASLAGVVVPVALDGANITFQGSLDGTNFYTLRDSTGAALAITLSGAGFYKVNPVNFLGVPFIKLVAASNQTTDRALSLVTGNYTE